MIFTDGECPLCPNEMLRLNRMDLLECPRCHFQMAVADAATATVILERGNGEFRDEPTRMAEVNGLMLAKSKNGGVEPDLQGIFQTSEEIKSYIDGCHTT